MPKESCELCGYNKPGFINKYYIVPQEISEQAGIKQAKMVRLCPNCQQELGKWYSARVADITYDTEMKQFKPKSPLQMVKEYEMAYQWFVHNKKEQLNKLKPKLL